MDQFKLKVYLGEQNAGQVLDGEPVPVVLTRWTYLLASTRVEKCGRRFGGELVSYFFYSDCIPADGSGWSLLETDGCIYKSDVEMPENYEVYDRAIGGIESVPRYARHVSTEEVPEYAI